MNSRQRLQATLNHKPADRVCVDMGAGAQTGIGICALHRLRQAVLGEEDYRIKVVEPYQMLSEVDEALRQTSKLDVAGIPTPSTMFGFPNAGWKPFTMHDGTPCLVPRQFNWTRDGAILMYPEGDTSVAPCAKMPKASFFFDALNRQRPLDEGRLDPAGELKKEFGQDVVFWGGVVDTQKTLPFGTPEEVYREVRERIDIFFEDGTGFVFNTVHNIQSNVPTANMLAMFRAVNDTRHVQSSFD